MKKLFLLFTLAFTILAFSSFAQNDVRPYLHWKIEYVKVDEETNEITHDSMLINTLEVEDAVSQFRVQCSYCEIRAAYRDYFYEGCTER